MLAIVISVHKTLLYFRGGGFCLFSFPPAHPSILPCPLSHTCFSRSPHLFANPPTLLQSGGSILLLLIMNLIYVELSHCCCRTTVLWSVSRLFHNYMPDCATPCSSYYTELVWITIPAVRFIYSPLSAIQYKYKTCFDKGVWESLAQSRTHADPLTKLLRGSGFWIHITPVVGGLARNYMHHVHSSSTAGQPFTIHRTVPAAHLIVTYT